MISYEAVLAQMGQLIAQAQQAPTDQHMREQLTAVRALCDVVLQQAAPQQAISPFQQLTTMSPPTTSMVKLQEPDANGDSIFDF